MLTQGDVDWLRRIESTGDIEDRRFVQYCQRQLDEDLRYLDACTNLLGRYTRRLCEHIKQRIKDRSYDYRYRACVEVGNLLKRADLERAFWNLEAAVRTCARVAFFHLHKEVHEEVMRRTNPAETSTPLA